MDSKTESGLLISWITDRNVQPQTARNIIAKLVGFKSADEKLQEILEALRQRNGSDVVIIRDQLHITIAVIFQTAMQKEFFRRWGDALVLDWTHGTNTLGFQLGKPSQTDCEYEADAATTLLHQGAW